MTQVTETSSTGDIRRAVERLQETTEELMVRHQEMRRERRQLRENLEESERLRRRAEQMLAENIERSAVDSEHVTELRDRCELAEKRQNHAVLELSAMQGIIAEREAMILEQAEILTVLRSELTEERHRSESLRAETEMAVGEATESHDDLRAAMSEVATLQAIIGELESTSATSATNSEEELNKLRSRNQEFLEQIAELRSENEMLADHLTVVNSQLERTTLKASEVENRVLALQQEVLELRDRLVSKEEKVSHLEAKVAQSEEEALQRSLNAVSSADFLELRKELDEALLSRQRLANELELLRAELVLAQSPAHSNGTGLQLLDDDRDEMIEQVSGAIATIDRYLKAS